MQNQSYARITAIATAVPGAPILQEDLAQRIAVINQMDESKTNRLKQFFRRTGIATRHSVLPDFYNGHRELFQDGQRPATSARMQQFAQHALPLSLQAIEQLRASQPFNAQDITHLVAVSCTGMSAPGLEIELLQALDLPLTLPRYTVNFMGCYAAVHGLRLAGLLAQTDPKARVLLVCTELCSLHFQDDESDDYLLAHSLFADGSAAVLVEGAQAAAGKPGLDLTGFSSALEPQGLDHMSWQIGDTGFLMRLSSYIPQLLGDPMRRLLQRINYFDKPRPRHFAIHPGGTRILKSFEEAAGLAADALWASYKVFKEVGNLSSPTVLFVLAQLWPRIVEEGGNVFMAAYGPGLTIEAAELAWQPA